MAGLDLEAALGTDARHAQSVLFSKDGHHLFTAGQGRVIKRLEAGAWQQTGELRGHRATSLLCCWLEDGRLVSVGSDHTVRTWDTEAEEELVRLDKAQWAVARPGHDELLVWHKNDRLARHDATTGQELALVPTLEDRVVSVAWHPAGQLVLVGGVGQVTVLEAERGKPVTTWPGHEGWVKTFQASPDGQVIASLGHDGRFVRWDPDGQILAASHVPQGVDQLAWHPQGTALAMAGKGHLFVLNMPDACTLAEERLEIDGLYGLGWDPQGRWLANAGADGQVRVWAWDDPRRGNKETGPS